MIALQPFLVFLVTMGGLFLLPGFCATSLILPRHDLDFFDRLPLGFSLSLGLLLVPFVIGTLLSWSWLRIQVLWVLIAVTLVVAALVSSRFPSSLRRVGPNASRRLTAPWVAILLFLLVASSVLTLLTPRDEDDWSYYQLVRSLADSAHLSPIPLTALRSGLNVWWFFHAFIVHSLDADLVRLGRDYVPLLMVPLSLLAFYSLAKSLFLSRELAVGACALQLASYVLDLFYNNPDVQLTGTWVLGRIDQDHTAAQFIFLPVYAILILRYVRSGDVRWLGSSFIILFALCAVHPQGFVQAGIVVAALLFPNWIARRDSSIWRKSLLILVPYVAILALLIPFISFWSDYAKQVPGFDLANIVQGQTVFPFVFRWLVFISPTLFFIAPDLLGQPILLGALLLIPWLMNKARTDWGARYLMGLMLGLVLLLYNPILFPLLARWLGWSIYRLWYMFPSALVISYAMPDLVKVLSNAWIHLRDRVYNDQAWRGVLCAAGLVLVLSRFPLYIRGMPLVLDAGRDLSQESVELLGALRQQPTLPGSAILAPLNISNAIPAYTSSLVPVLFRYDTPRERTIDADELYSDTLLTSRDFEILSKYKVTLLVVPTDHENISQFDLFPFYFVRLFRNDDWALYEFSPPRVEDPLIHANDLFRFGEWQAAIDAYNFTLTGNKKPQVSSMPNDFTAWRVFLPFAGLRYDPTVPEEEVRAQMRGRQSLAHTGLGVVLELSNLPRKAIAEFEEAVKVEPGNAQAHYHLALLYRKLAMDPQADEHTRLAGPLIQHVVK